VVLATAPQQLVRQRQVDRRALVRRQHITFQRRLLIALELSIGWIDFKQSVGSSSLSSTVDSDNRLAARPVGAHNSALPCFARGIVSIELTSVVFPPPGPPVMTSSYNEKATRIACFWLLAS